METISSGDLIRNALRLKEVDRQVVKSVAEGKYEDVYELLDEFRDLKRTLRIHLIDRPVVKINNEDAKRIIKKVRDENVFKSDIIIKYVEEATGEKLNVDELDVDERIQLGDELGDDLFYSWFDHIQYIDALYSIGSLIIGISVPDILKVFVDEARLCYAFQQYNAVYSLCRTILEVAIRDINKRKRLIRESKGNLIYLEQYQISELIHNVSRGKLEEKIKEMYYKKTSPLIHGRKTIKEKECKEIFGETLKTVEKLYSYNGF